MASAEDILEEEDNLFERFKKRWPTLFNNVRCGFYLPKGWEGIVWSLCEHLEQIGLEGIVVDQVKEKFGGLRFYAQGLNEKHRKAVNDIESLSFYVCQKCGSTEQLKKKPGNWVGYYCGSCLQKI